MSSEDQPTVPSFEPLTRATNWKLVLAAAVGSMLWLVALVVGGIVLERTEAIEFGLLAAGAAFMTGLIVLSVLRTLRLREERRYRDGS
jgi:hypothetical protein